MGYPIDESVAESYSILQRQDAALTDPEGIPQDTTLLNLPILNGIGSAKHPLGVADQQLLHAVAL